jgi:hypothetical protein
MPYKDPERKKEWERLHRSERLNRRRESRRRTTAQSPVTRPEVSGEHGGAGFLIPVIAGSTLAACNPKWGMTAGGLTLVIAAVGKKGAQWWIVGIVVLVVALFSYLNNQNPEDLGSSPTN